MLAFPLVLFGGITLISSMMFNDMHHPLQGSAYLTLPASQLEKLLARFFLSLFGYLLYLIPLYLCFIAFSDKINILLFGNTHLNSNSILTSFLLTLFGYAVLHAIFFLGSIYFTKQAAIRTALVLVLTAGAIYGIERFCFYIAFHNTGVIKFTDFQYPIEFFLPYGWVYSMYPLWLTGTFILLMSWIISYIRFKEKEA